MPAHASADDTALLDARALSKLHWRCRRGLLENDLFIDQFFRRYEHQITVLHRCPCWKHSCLPEWFPMIGQP